MAAGRGALIAFALLQLVVMAILVTTVVIWTRDPWQGPFVVGGLSCLTVIIIAASIVPLAAALRRFRVLGSIAFVVGEIAGCFFLMRAVDVYVIEPRLESLDLANPTQTVAEARSLIAGFPEE